MRGRKPHNHEPYSRKNVGSSCPDGIKLPGLLTRVQGTRSQNFNTRSRNHTVKVVLELPKSSAHFVPAISSGTTVTSTKSRHLEMQSYCTETIITFVCLTHNASEMKEWGPVTEMITHIAYKPPGSAEA
jgi:hypothetical protein